jgi:hypothetical protein
MAAPIRHLREGKVFAQLSEKEEQDSKSWIYDTGATKHMSGSRVAFTELNRAVHGTVRFGDDLVAEIEGRELVSAAHSLEYTSYPISWQTSSASVNQGF